MNGLNARKRGNAGKEWWGKRPLSGIEVRNNGMKFWKRLLHKKERVKGKKLINNKENGHT
jgi:hypothetical protein